MRVLLVALAVLLQACVAPVPPSVDERAVPTVQTHALSRAQRPTLGVMISDLAAPVPGASAGVKVGSVFPGSAAEAAGLAPGDVIVELLGASLTSADQLAKRIAKMTGGDDVHGVYVRGGQRHQFAAQLRTPLVADARVWGVYAQMIDRSWRSGVDMLVRWSIPGEELIETVKIGIYSGSDTGKLLYRMKIRPGERPGQLVGHMIEGENPREYEGQIGEDGEVNWNSSKRLFDHEYFHIKPTGYGAVEVDYSGLRLGTNFQVMSLYAADMASEVLPAQWGVLSMLEGGYWETTQDGERLLHGYRWLVPGVLMKKWAANLDQGFDSLETISALPDGSLEARVIEWWQPVAPRVGMAAPDGSVRFATRGTSVLKSEWGIMAEQDGSFRYFQDATLDTLRSGILLPVEDVQARGMIASANEARRQQKAADEAASAERSELFGALVLGTAQVLAEGYSEYATQQAQQQAYAAQLAATAASAQQQKAAAESVQPHTPAANGYAVPAQQSLKGTSSEADEAITPYVAVQGNGTGSWEFAGSPQSHSAASGAGGSNLSPTPEAVFVCTIPNENGKFECDSPVTSGLDGGPKSLPEWRTPESMVASMSSACPDARRLQSSTHMVWGCGFGATNNSNSMDRSDGVDVQGRRTYYCAERQTGCRRTSP